MAKNNKRNYTIVGPFGCKTLVHGNKSTLLKNSNSPVWKDLLIFIHDELTSTVAKNNKYDLPNEWYWYFEKKSISPYSLASKIGIQRFVGAVSIFAHWYGSKRWYIPIKIIKYLFITSIVVLLISAIYFNFVFGYQSLMEYLGWRNIFLILYLIILPWLMYFLERYLPERKFFKIIDNIIKYEL